MTEQAEIYYRNYWKTDEEDTRNKRNYYVRLYRHLLYKLLIPSNARVLDIAGGNGQFLHFLGVKQADILDISESGVEAARFKNYRAILGDIQKRFPIKEESYDVAFLCEVLEHLQHPSITLVEAYHVLKSGGVLYVAQPNMRADGRHHVRRYYPDELIDDLKKSGFKIMCTDVRGS